MAYTSLYHLAAAREDIPQIQRNLQRRIATAIASRLTDAPQHYGAPLTCIFSDNGISDDLARREEQDVPDLDDGQRDIFLESQLLVEAESSSFGGLSQNMQ